MKKPKAKLRKELDALFSKYIRFSDIEPDGMVSCYTCPNRNVPQKMQNGHFIPRQYLSLRYDETNNHPQCYACNMLYNGQPGAYAVRLEQDYGEGTVARLEAKRRDIIPNFPYEELIETYREKVATLLDTAPIS